MTSPSRHRAATRVDEPTPIPEPTQTRAEFEADFNKLERRYQSQIGALRKLR